MHKLKLFSGNANLQLANAIAQYLGIKLSSATVSRYNDGEIRIEINENVRGADVFVIQPTCAPANDNLMELLILIDALRRASADKITAVIPYFGYARQDRKAGYSEPITAKLVADLLSIAGPHRILTLDLHASQIQGFFNIPLDNLHPDPVLLAYLRERFAQVRSNFVIVALSAGGARRARRLARRMMVNFAFIDERRAEGEGSYEVVHVVGDITPYACFIDDIIDSGVSVTKAALAIQEKGAQHIYACATHGLFTGNALQLIEASPIKEVVVTNSIPQQLNFHHNNTNSNTNNNNNNNINTTTTTNTNTITSTTTQTETTPTTEIPTSSTNSTISTSIAQSTKLRVLSVAPLLGETIRRTHNEESVAGLFLS